MKNNINEKSVSIEQQRLMGMAYAVRMGKLDRDKVGEEVLKLVDGGMTDKQLKDFASTTHKEIEDMDKDKENTNENKNYKIKHLSSFINEQLLK